VKSKLPSAEIGVIIGRFQVPSLHEGHKELIDFVRHRHKKVLILVGSTPKVHVTRKDPLDFYTRKLMLQRKYPELSILPLQDMPSDDDWSRSVDTKIEETYPLGAVLIYGSRDSFIPHYHGKHETVELDNSKSISGAQVREDCSDDVREHEEFRRGVIYAAFNKYPVVYPTVDIAVIQGHKVALGRKPDYPPGKWRFPGGFADPGKDESFLHTARREASEELTQPALADWKLLGSVKIDDWRYRTQADSIITTVFAATLTWGTVKAGDDLAEAKLFDLDTFKDSSLVPQHLPILRMVKEHLGITDKTTRPTLKRGQHVHPPTDRQL